MGQVLEERLDQHKYDLYTELIGLETSFLSIQKLRKLKSYEAVMLKGIENTLGLIRRNNNVG